jgi:hypothetical protein
LNPECLFAGVAAKVPETEPQDGELAKAEPERATGAGRGQEVPQGVRHGAPRAVVHPVQVEKGVHPLQRLETLSTEHSVFFAKDENEYIRQNYYVNRVPPRKPRTVLTLTHTLCANQKPANQPLKDQTTY